MSPALKSWLAELRQHPLFPQLLRAVDRPKPPRYLPSRQEDIPAMGARAIFASGQMAQDEVWRFVLTGVPLSGEDEKE